jgi:hypothetical protein
MKPASRTTAGEITMLRADAERNGSFHRILAAAAIVQAVADDGADDLEMVEAQDDDVCADEDETRADQSG